MTEHNKIKNENNETLKAGCVIVNEKKEVLLISDTGPEITTPEGKIWAYPKGHAEKGETLEQVALREVQEETGYKVEIVKRLSDLTYAHGKTGELIRVAMFKARLLESGVPTEIEIQSKWFSVDEAKKVIYHNLAFLLDELE
jgi:ADP-ribose pyrophosphatase YjhB (NUDIX family)